LLRLLRELLGLPIPLAAYTDLGDIGGNPSAHLRHAHTLKLIDRAARDDDGAGTLYDHPLLRLEIAGYTSYLEPDVVAFRLAGRFHIVEIKSFAIVDGQAEPDKVAAAARQAAVYVLALRKMLAELGHDPGRVSHEVVLVCPENFANRPAATLLDVRRELAVLGRQLSRMARVGAFVDTLPPDLTFDLAPDADGLPTRPVAELREAVRTVGARYAPECLSTCDLCFFCRDEAASEGSTELLGRHVRDALGGVATVSEALGLADGSLIPGEGQEEIARLLRLADRIYAEAG
jgi:hypothetical protein